MRAPAEGGERRARFAAVYDAFARTVHGIVLAHVGSADADDVTQEAFVQVYRGLERIRDEAALAPWVCTVARNTSIDHLRRARRRPRLADVPVEEVQVGGVETARDAGELADRVLALVRDLPDAYRETLVLRLVEGLTGPEIAGRTGLTHGSVRVNLTRGMALLRPLLQKEGYP